ncbi:MAG: RidA family protein [Pseudomonadales bacterium]
MSRDIILPEADRRAYDSFHFAPGVLAGDFVLCSGQIGLNSQGRVPESAEEEFRNAWSAVARILGEASLGLDNIVEYTSYHVGLHEHLPLFMKVRDDVLQPPWPAWTAIGITELAVPGARVEIRVTARR